MVVEYIENPGNPLKLRLAAFEVLAFLNEKKFVQAQKQLDSEFAKASPKAQASLRVIENRKEPFFDGSYDLVNLAE